VELAALAVFLLLPPVAAMLGHAPPPPAGLAIAVLSMPALLLVDLAYKQLRRRAGRNG
jgi:hypothetical protein